MSLLPDDEPRHRISLKGFWHLIQTAEGLWWERSFGRPAHWPSNERVWLVAAQLPPDAAVYLNGQPLGFAQADGCWSAEVTSRLQPRNRLQIRASHPPPALATTLSPASEAMPNPSFIVEMRFYDPHT
ncbi:MAG: hypothetical protein NZU63_10255 [Gemmataceae bacterium]|nr:hypothetical protein [Gemmataceae bacterium]